MIGSRETFNPPDTTVRYVFNFDDERLPPTHTLLMFLPLNHPVSVLLTTQKCKISKDLQNSGPKLKRHLRHPSFLLSNSGGTL